MLARITSATVAPPPFEPWRGAPGGHPLPRRPQPLVSRRGRPRKAWRWVGCFSDEVLLCAASARVGPARVDWWAVWDREQRTLAERTTRRRGHVAVEGARVSVADGPVSVELELDLGAVEGVETVSPHGEDGWAWTVKRGGVPMRGSVVIGDRRIAVDGRGIVDDSGGHHARETAWRWSAGVGVAETGAAVAWNLVDGLHDAPGASERTVWIDGAAHQVAPQAFADDLSGVGDLRFSTEARRARRERLLVVSSDYEQPFGTFTGELPVAGRLVSGLGVMERHAARW